MQYDAAMTILLPAIKPETGAPSSAYTDVVIPVSARVVTAEQARRTVNGWLCMEVGDRMLAGEPELLVGEQLLWRVPVAWTSPTLGVFMPNISYVMVDASTGAAFTNPELARELQARAVLC